MKRTIRTILYAAAAVVLAAASCEKSIEPANPVEESKGTIDICVNGLMGEYTQQDGVKSSLVNNVRVAWAAGDVVYVFDGSKYLGKLTAALDKKADGQTDEDRYAKLSGTISAPATTSCVLSLVHSSLMTEPAAGAAVSELSIDMSAQSTDTAPFVAYATMNYTGESISDAVVPFQFATSVIKVNCTGLKAKTAINKATLSNVNTVCMLTLSGSVAPTVSGGANGTITRTNDEYFATTKVNAEGEAVFQIAVPKLETASGARVLTVAQGSDEVKDKNFSKKDIKPATSVNTVCQLVGLPAGALKGEFSVSDTKKVHFSKGNLYYNGSKFDFEANQYECHGYDSANNIWGLFGWVGTSSTTFNSSPEIYGVSTSATSSDYGNVAGEALKADWGTAIDDKGTWSTLSTTEWQYLFNYGSYQSDIRKNKYKWATVKGVKGYVIAPDDFSGELASSYADDSALAADNLVFLPAAGLRDGSSVDYVGVNGTYWSSSSHEDAKVANTWFINDQEACSSNSTRYLGLSVRLITE